MGISTNQQRICIFLQGIWLIGNDMSLTNRHLRENEITDDAS